jgi:hypothetical protein
MSYDLSKSTRKDKKYSIKPPNQKNTIIHFGAEGYEDFTTHQDEVRKERYISRHKQREDWNKTGINTSGFWSRWLLWNKPTLVESIKDTEKRFNIKIKL